MSKEEKEDFIKDNNTFNPVETILPGESSDKLTNTAAKELAAKIIADQKRKKELEEQSGKAFTEAALSEFTLGGSDQLFKKLGLATSRELRERRETAAGTAGTVLGFGGSLLVPGGAGKLATRAGKFARKATEKALKEGAEGAAARRLLKDVTARGVEGAVEATPFSVGQLVKEDALGTADFNADNLMASVGAGAFIGGGVGSFIGGAKALAPLASKSQVVKKAEALFDRKNSALEVVGISTPAQKAYIKNKHPLVYNNIEDYLVKDLNMMALGDIKDLIKANDSVLATSGKSLGKIYKQGDEFLNSNNLTFTPTNSYLGSTLADFADSASSTLKGSGVGRQYFRELRSFSKDMRNLAKEEGSTSLNRMWELKKLYGNKLEALRDSADNPMREVMRKAVNTLREEIENTVSRIEAADAEGILGAALAELKQSNKRYSIAKTMKPYLDKADFKQQSFVSTKDIITAGAGGILTGDPAIAIGLSAAKRLVESDIRRKIIVLGAANDSLRAAQKAVNKSMQNFASGAKKAATAASTKALASSNFSNKIEEGKKPKKPKDRKEAYNNLRENIEKATTDPDFLARRMMISTSHLRNTMPKTSEFIEDRVLRAVNFLNSKLPVNQNLGRYPHMKREFEPSSFELARFERYLQVIESPLSILEDLESRSLTRDHVEAMAAVYPNLYERMRNQAMEVAADPKTNLGYDQRIQLGILMEFDSDPSMEPMRVQGLQANFGQEQEVQAQAEMQEGAVKPTVGGLKEVQFAERQKTSRLGSLIRRQG